MWRDYTDLIEFSAELLLVCIYYICMAFWKGSHEI